MAAGTVIATCMKRHRAQDCCALLDEMESAVPAGRDIDVFTNNASSHKTRTIQDRFATRSRMHRHFTPTSASWLNQAGRSFALLIEWQIKRGADRSTDELETATQQKIGTHNHEAKHFRWTKSADDILAIVERCCQRPLGEHEKVEQEPESRHLAQSEPGVASGFSLTAWHRSHGRDPRSPIIELFPFLPAAPQFNIGPLPR